MGLEGPGSYSLQQRIHAFELQGRMQRALEADATLRARGTALRARRDSARGGGG